MFGTKSRQKAALLLTKLWAAAQSLKSNQGGPQNTGGVLLEFPMRTAMHGNLAFRLQHLFAIINKIS